MSRLTVLFHPRFEQPAVLIAAVLAHGLLFIPEPLPGFVAAAMLLFVLPGWAWAACLNKQAASWAERFVLSLGLSFALTVVAGLVVHYLPGPVHRWHVLLANDLLMGSGLLISWLLRWHPSGQSRRPVGPVQATSLYVLLAILFLAALYRFVWLGYSEFQGDEALVTWSAARSLTGEDDMLFLHGKSPAEIILSANLWALTGWFTELMARFPFALAGWGSVLMAFLLGRRLLGERPAFIAAFLFAINGYLIGFSRVVQYQSLVVFLSLMAVYAAYRAWQEDSNAFQLVSALFAGTSLLAHYDAVVILPAIAWLWARRLWPGAAALGVAENPSSRRWKMGVLTLALFLLPVAAFYVPMVHDLQFKEMFHYLTSARVGSNWFNNHWDFLLRSGTVYNSAYYTAVLFVALIGLILVPHSGRGRCHADRSEAAYLRYLVGFFLLLVLTTILWPAWWQIGAANLALVPFVLLVLVSWLDPGSTVGVRLLWLWFGVAALAYLFVLALPLSHLYNMMPPLILLAAAGWEKFLASAAQYVGKLPWLRYVSYICLGGLLFVLACYPYLVFVNHQPEFTQAYRERPLPLYWRPDARLPEVGLFGFPHRSGWKAVGWLYDKGILRGDYLSNEEEWVTLWYTHFAPTSCTPDATYYLLAANPWDAVPVPAELIAGQYQPVTAVTVEGETRLRILAREALDLTNLPDAMLSSVAELAPVPALDVAAVEAAFDRSSAPGRFVQNKQPQTAFEVQFGEAVKLLGYDLEPERGEDTSIQPGERLNVTLYWLALRPLTENYHVFVQLGDERLWARSDGAPVCGRLPTSLWRPGKVVIDRRRLDLSPDTPEGAFPLRVGLYLPEIGERLVPMQHRARDNSVILNETKVHHYGQ